jgi:peptidoglycan hydrolase-like protein with peptidoglycan-binding domain
MESRAILTAVVVSSLALGAQSCYSAREHRAVEPPARSAASQQTFASVQNVKQAEQTLKKKGYDPGAIDGVMDSQLHQALSEFQRANRLPVTGNLDDQTARMLGIKLAGDTGFHDSFSHTKTQSPEDSGSRPGTGLRQ